MCTLTIIPCNLSGPGASETGIRVVCNRDESRLRPAALPPQLLRFGSRSAFMPVDPLSDGTWIAVSDAGLVFVLMNVNVKASKARLHEIGPAPARPILSRGTIIPFVLQAANLSEARVIVATMYHQPFAPFRLVIADRANFAEFVWAEGRGHASEPETIEQPLLFTSSGLGDDVVAVPRRRLFDECFASRREWRVSQDEFHRHSWMGNEHVSVWMTREDALTVSRTEVELGSDRLTMNYHARVGNSPELVDSETMTLQITGSICHASA